jgi:hypothetical protein
MNNIRLEVSERTKNNCVHLRVYADKDDLGFLYLDQNQYSKILGIFRAGCFSKEIELNITDPYLEEE